MNLLVLGEIDERFPRENNLLFYSYNLTFMTVNSGRRYGNELIPDYMSALGTAFRTKQTIQ